MSFLFGFITGVSVIFIWAFREEVLAFLKDRFTD